MFNYHLPAEQSGVQVSQGGWVCQCVSRSHSSRNSIPGWDIPALSPKLCVLAAGSKSRWWGRNSTSRNFKTPQIPFFFPEEKVVWSKSFPERIQGGCFSPQNVSAGELMAEPIPHGNVCLEYWIWASPAPRIAGRGDRSCSRQRGSNQGSENVLCSCQRVPGQSEGKGHRGGFGAWRGISWSQQMKRLK